MNLTNKKVAVLGAGRSGQAAARLALHHGANVCIFDSSDAVTNIPEGVNFIGGATETDGHEYAADLVVISPGIEANCPFTRSFLDCAEELIGELELACRFYSGKIIAITGTNGKTTTTALLEKILLKAGKKAVACGNFGVPVSELLLRDEIPEILALEASSFQLETVKQFHADIAIWLNFAPDHMDRYTSVEDYYNDKLHIFDNQTSDDYAIIRVGETLPLLRARVETFSSVESFGTLSYSDGQINEGHQPLLDLRGTTMAQSHNAENVMAALLACRALGVSTEIVAETLRDFSPPGHRCEVVKILDGVTWMNDSKSTNLHSTEAALRSQTTKVVLIIGGKDKGLDYAPLKPLLAEKVRACIVFGQIKDQLFDVFAPVVPSSKLDDVEGCVNAARDLARPGDVVLFSPGTSSFDMFTGYVQRGQVFRDAVEKL
ncbi:MAG: UDP-N-acetylmuramoyl-L-alanine--D-glutamate ligase [Akkermansia sp.]